MTKNNFLVTGTAGFIGAATCKRLLEDGKNVTGIDNLNNYYSPAFKHERLKELLQHPNFTFIQEDIRSKSKIEDIFDLKKPDTVIHLAAQAGVRYSIENPDEYITSNLNGFFNILDLSKKYNVQKFIFASSSSVYAGLNKIPFSEDDRVDEPISLYAATKKSNELMAHAYSNLYDMTTIGLRFFSVYGPHGRPDMAVYLFTKAILEGQPIKLFNSGNMTRDFTYIDDITTSILKICDLSKFPNEAKYAIYNIGGGSNINLKEMVIVLETILKKKALFEHHPLQPGDIVDTQSDTSKLNRLIHFESTISLQVGLENFVRWYKTFHGI